jgi:DNA mismatch repair protein MutL
VLALSLDPHSVDMNVHPTKREVRFSDHEQLHALIHKRLRRAIGPGVTVTVAAARNASDGTPEPIGPSRSGMGVEIPYSQVRDPLPPRVAEPVQGYLPAVGAEVRPLGQIADRYVLAQIEQELHIVDQHTAHERVLFERLCTELERGMIPSQRSLLPQTIELPSHAAILLRAHLLELERLGFEVEDFGGGAFFVRAVPALFGESGGACDSLLHALLEEWEEEGSTASLRERYHAPLATVACHSAVRSGRKLEPAEIQRLLEGWQDAGLPSTCPHGRRIAMRLTIEELDRIFGRAGWK